LAAAKAAAKLGERGHKGILRASAVEKTLAKYRHSYMWVLFYAIFSLLFIYIGHQAYLYVAQPYKKKRFVVDSQIEQYKSIIRELQEQTAKVPSTDPSFDDVETDLEEFMRTLPTTDILPL
jgi:hypothetical protein